MTSKKLGTQTVLLKNPPSLIGYACVVGKKEGAGPLKDSFDYIAHDDKLEQSTWEKSESAFQKKALALALEKANLCTTQLDYLFAGDLLNQCISSSFAAREQDIPFLGLYGACSTMGEGLALAAMTIDGGFGTAVGVLASSHFCTAERQYRTPLAYGSQRTPTAQWTVTGAGAVIVSATGDGPYITHCTLGKIVDRGIKDTNNMGAAMAPAAYETIKAHLADTGRTPDFYDLIITGDLGEVGRELLLELFRQDDILLESNHTDCGLLIFDCKGQDVHSGGSGCGCCASVLSGYLLNGMASEQWSNILFCPTGALHSPISSCQGESIPAICHAVAISAQSGQKG